MKNLLVVLWITAVTVLSIPAFADSASDASSVDCTCKKQATEEVVCALNPFPGHLEGVAFKPAECTQSDSGSYACSNSKLDFSDGSKLSSVSCRLSSGKSKMTAEIENDSFLSGLKHMADTIISGGDSETKDQLVSGTKQVNELGKKYEEKQDANQKAMDAYQEALKPNAGARAPASQNP